MDGVYIWLFHFKSGQWVARSNVANTGVHATAGQTPHHVQVVTAFVGQLGFQVLAGRWPTGRRLAMNSAAVRESEPATKLLWPDPLERYRWAAHSGYLADATLM